MGSLHAMQVLWVLFALLLATRKASSSPPVESSNSIEERAEVSVPSGHNIGIEKRGGSWSQLQGAWGKRGGWSQLHGAWGKRAAYPEQDEEDLLQDETGNKRANWNSLQGSWGKRATWSNLQGSWGKRDTPLALIDTLEKRARWHDLQGSWGKRDWSQLHGAWGKRNYLEDEVADEGGATGGVVMPDDSDYVSGAVLPLQKRVWSKFVGSWGKRPDTLRPLSSRSANWSSLRGSWGKRASNWSSMRGSWGKRAAEGVDDEVATSDVMGLK